MHLLKQRLLLSAVVPQVLEKHNYVDWSVQVKYYLMAHGLWEIIEVTIEPPKQEDDEVAFRAWSTKNSMALNVIQVSCGSDTFSEIFHISLAKIAWDTLANKYSVPRGTNSGPPSLSLNCANAHNIRHVLL
jgi:hypothetical protein